MKSVRKRTPTVLKPDTFTSDENSQTHIFQSVDFLAQDLSGFNS